MKRRSFLKNSSLLSVPLVLGGVPLSAMEKSRLFEMIGGDTDRVLVLIQLDGGNDGLNTLIPLDQYENLHAIRENIIIPENKIIPLEDTNGLHPAWSEMKQMYDEEKLAIVQSVGYPDQNRSHFRSTDIWNTASASNEFLDTGWVGRYLDLKIDNFPSGYPNEECPDPFAITMGNIISETCQGQSSNFSFVLNKISDLEAVEQFEGGGIDDGCYGNELHFVRETVRQSNAYVENVKSSYDAGENLSEYDNSRLGRQMQTIARLISGGSQTRIYVARLGGFDTHAAQVEDGDPTTGKHGELLADISKSIKSFQEDIDAQGNGERVIGMTFSEFGRRIRSNDALGTDHGSAAPLFVFGNCVNPGILGSNPEISTDVDVKEGVPMQYDFRSVYGSVLMDWFGLEEPEVKELLFEDFQHLPILRSCSGVFTEDTENESLKVSLYPNPTSDIVNLEFQSFGGKVHISVLDAVGHVMDILTDRTIGAGQQKISIDLQKYRSGVYFVRVAEAASVMTRRVVRQ